MKILLYILLLIPIATFSQQTKNKVIIDSDAGTDDYRSLLLFSQIKNYEIKAITLSDGTLFPDKGAVRVTQLIHCLNNKNIFVGVGRKTMYTKPVWRLFAEKVPWGDCSIKDSIKEFPNATQIINKILDESSQKSITFICLGSLSNLYETLMINPKAVDKIKEVIWYNSTNIKQGTNYTFEPKAADYILSLPIKIKIIHAINEKHVNYDTAFINKIKSIKNKQAQLIAQQLEFLRIKNNLSHLQCWDELCAIYMANPKIYTFKEKTENPFVQVLYDYDTTQVRTTYLQILKGTCKLASGVVFSEFPTDSFYLQNDVFEVKEKLIEKYGYDEFKAAILTSEIHNHLGIYSIIGVKMGIKAMELLNASNSEIKIKSFAGNTPPLSCLNDGLMVSTGSTPAYNLLKIDTTQLFPSAIFCFKNQCIKITLKKEIYEHITKYLNDAVLKYSLSSDAYWNYVRKKAIEEWLNLNRNNIFDIEKTNSN
ncbi:MAG: nucleoside hydrolase [Bacteroidales bacterium]|nr:nucleoside hydrolase [Bacteroidales bacterium]